VESLTSLMSMLAASSLLGVLGATLLERLVPILPSYLLLLSIGIATARADGSLIAMVSASALGSVSGCGIHYCAASSIGLARTRRWGSRLARLCGVSQRRMRRLSVALQRNAPPLSLVSQLVPGLRLVAPGMAGAVGVPALTYFSFASIGIAIWNLFFIGAGYFAAQRNPQADTTSIALVVIGIFLGIEATVGTMWWAWGRYRRAHGPISFRPAAVSNSGAQAIVE
jgi:membrane protein DedA with SNARE-associated domain